MTSAQVIASVAHQRASPVPFDPPGSVRTSVKLNPSLERSWRERGKRIWSTPQTQITIYDDPEEKCEVIVKAVRRKNGTRDKLQMLRKNFQQSQVQINGKVMLSTEQSILREIAIMKACRHANIVRLLGVVDDPDRNHIYMTMEHCRGGRVVWQTIEEDSVEPHLTVNQARRIFRDVVVGLEYLHYMGIIHRDIKPDNLVWTENRRSVKIIDFGISYFNPDLRSVPFARWRKGLESLKETALFPPNNLTKLIGTDYFIAPEVVGIPNWEEPSIPTTSINSQPPTASAAASSNTIAMASISSSTRSSSHVEQTSTPPLPPSTNGHASTPGTSSSRPPITKAIDVWSLGVTLYCLLFGALPFDVTTSPNQHAGHVKFKLYKEICTKDWITLETMGADRQSTGGRYPNDEFSVIRLLDRMLQKDPSRRISLHDIKRHPWVTADLPDSSDWIEDTSPAQLYRPRPYRFVRRMLRHIFERFSKN